MLKLINQERNFLSMIETETRNNVYTRTEWKKKSYYVSHIMSVTYLDYCTEGWQTYNTIKNKQVNGFETTRESCFRKTRKNIRNSFKGVAL